MVGHRVYIIGSNADIYIYIERRDPKIRGLDNEDHSILGLPRTAKPTGIFCLTCERKVTDPPCFLTAGLP